MKRIWAIAKKEFRRYFTDPRMLAALFLPGILIFLIYTALGNFVQGLDIGSVEPDYSYRIAYSDNYGSEEEPALLTAFSSYLASSGHTGESVFLPYEPAKRGEMLSDLAEGELDIVISFSEGFESILEEGPSLSPTRPNVDIYYNASHQASEQAYSLLLSLTGVYDAYTVNASIENPNVGGESFTMNSLFSFLFPMIVTSLLFSSCLSICPESIAGEKERGTIASILITPIRPWELATGKIVSLSVLAVLSGTVSALGLIASLPTMLGGMSISLSPISIAGLFFAVVSLLLMMVAGSSLVSAFAKTIKEATGYLGPLTAILVILAVLPMALDLTPIGFAFVPFLNVIVCMSSVFSTPVSILYWAISIVESLLIAGFFLFLTVRLFRSERAMFG